MLDVIIVGAGTAGLHLAKKLSDLNVTVLERKKIIGEKACSGLYSSDMEKIEKIPKEAIEHRIEKMILHSPSDKTIDVKIKQRPWVVDRKIFNRLLAEKLDVHVGEELINFSVDNYVSVKTNKRTLISKILVGADGSNSTVRNSFGIKPQDIVNGLIAYVDEEDYSDYVDVWIDKNICKDGFLWKIPRGKRTEYGMLGYHSNFKQLEKFFGLDNYEKKAAIIPAGFHKTFFNRVLLLGDAACQTKPWSLGGVLYGFVAGDIAADVIRKNLEKPNEKNLEEYEIRWKRDLWESIQKGLFFREIFKSFNNKKIDSVFEDFGSLIKDLDMDHPFLNIPL